MAKLLVPDDLWAAIAPLLPPEPAKPKGGRPRLSDRAALTGILFVLKSGLPWEMLPAEMGCGSGMSCWRRLRDWHEAGVWTALHRVLLEHLHAAGQLDWRRAALDGASVQAKRGDPRPGRTRPTAAGPAAKRHIAVDARGTPLGVLIGPANQHDSRMLASTLDAIPPVHNGRRGRPRQRPDKGFVARIRARRECLSPVSISGGVW